MIRVATWNVEWATPETKAGKRIQQIIQQIDPDIFVLTEGCRELMPEGFVLDGGTGDTRARTSGGEKCSCGRAIPLLIRFKEKDSNCQKVDSLLQQFSTQLVTYVYMECVFHGKMHMSAVAAKTVRHGKTTARI
jgi:hypothetical protein